MTDSFPLYMQHNGHSRVVVGVAVRGPKHKRETQLLVFDPASYGPELASKLADNSKGWHGMIKRGLHTLRKPEYEFVVVAPNETFDRERSKIPEGSNTCF